MTLNRHTPIYQGITLWTVMLAAMLLTACGGSEEPQIPTVPGYTGSTEPAILNATSSPLLIRLAYESMRSGEAARAGLTSRPSGSSANPLGAIGNCSGMGGEATVNWYEGDDYTVGGDLVYTGFCLLRQSEEIVINGQADFTWVAVPGQTVSTLSMKLKSLNVYRRDSFDRNHVPISQTLSGTVTYSISSDRADKTTMSLLLRDELLNKNNVYKASASLSATFPGSDRLDTISGSFHHPVHGMVDTSSPAPLLVAGGDFFPTAGAYMVNGAAPYAARVDFTAPSAVGVETTGDNTFDDIHGVLLDWWP